MNVRKLLTRITIAVAIVGGVVIAGLLLWPSKPPIPGPIKGQLTSALLVPRGSGYNVNRESASYDSKLQLLTFKLTAPGGVTLTMSEQPAPSQFADIDGYYATFAQKLATYDDFDSALGHVYLIRPNDASSDGAVLYSSGTLLFAKPDKQLSGDAWRKLFRAMAVVR